MNYCIIYLASPLNGYNSILSTGEKRIFMLQNSIKNITQYLNLPVIIFHEDFTDDIKLEILNIYNNTSFEQVDMIRNDLLFKNKPCKTSGDYNKCSCNLNKNTKVKHCWRPKGYLMMCRFFCGELQRHPAIQKYDGYIRFDDDSFLIQPFINQNIFLQALNNNDYVFRSIFKEGQDQTELFNFTLQFCKSKGFDINNILNRLKKLGILNGNNIYNGLAPYNNFHFCKLSLWKEPIINEYIDKIEEVGGILKKGWMDANIHAMIVFIIIPEINKKAYLFTNFGYRHNRHFSLLNNHNITYIENERFFPIVL